MFNKRIDTNNASKQTTTTIFPPSLPVIFWPSKPPKKHCLLVNLASKKLFPQKMIACQWRSSLPGRLSPTRVWVSSVGDRARGSLGSRPSHRPTIGEKLGKRDHYEHDLPHTNITMHCVHENDFSWLWVSSIDRLPLETARATKPSICSAIWKRSTNATAENRHLSRL